MVKNKNFLIKLQFFFIFLIPLTPHLSISSNFQLDDIPVILSLIFFVFNLYFKNFDSLYIKECIPFIIFITYISVQNFIINDAFIYSENLRFIFYLTLFVSVLNIKKLEFLDQYFLSLLLFTSIFSILFYFLEYNFGSDSYKYWKIGFNENRWIFTNGRMNGLQSGGPNVFGGLIACLTVYCASKFKNIYKYFVIFLGVLGCFFTYSRASILIIALSLILYLILNKDVVGIITLSVSITICLNFGLIERFSSESETEGIQDRIEMQEASISNISSRSLNDNLFGYGHNNFGIVRSELKSIEEFSDDIRPTGPHNSFLFIILNYGFIGLLLFLNLFLKSLRIFFKQFDVNLLSSNYLFMGSFIALSLTGDFIQNHSISVLFFITLFQSIKLGNK